MAPPLVLLPSFSVDGNYACELLVLQGSCTYPGHLRWFCNPACLPVPGLTCRVESNSLLWWRLADGVVRVAGENSCLLVIYKIHLLTSGRKGKGQVAVLQPGCLLADLAVGDGALVLTEAFQPCPRKAQNPFYSLQPGPSRGGMGIKRDVELSQFFHWVCKVPEAIQWLSCPFYFPSYRHPVEGSDMFTVCLLLC